MRGESQRVLIVPDKFKGTLTAYEAVDAIARGWRSVRPHDRLDELPMSDGGEGFGDVIGRLLGAKRHPCATVDAVGRSRSAGWWCNASTRVGVIESSEVIGLALLPVELRRPFQLDTRGLGPLFESAAAAGVRELYVGLGGSATNDGGFGLARSLGWEFLDDAGNELQAWTELTGLARVVGPATPLMFVRLIMAADVCNPLLGPRGATHTFGPQKGLRPSEITLSERCLERLVAVVEGGIELASEPGAGAAGGLGFGVRAFCGGTLVSGAEVFARLAELQRHIDDADCVVTGEGAFDDQTAMGKGVGVVATMAARAGKRCIALAGSVDRGAIPDGWQGFEAFSIVPDIASWSRALAEPEACSPMGSGRAQPGQFGGSVHRLSVGRRTWYCRSRPPGRTPHRRPADWRASGRTNP